MDVNTFRIVMTIVSFVVFIGIIAWALAPGNRPAFREAALIPLNDDELPAAPGTSPRTKGNGHG